MYRRGKNEKEKKSTYLAPNQTRLRMALIKFSAVVGAASGTSGGTTFSRNRGGSYVRTWAKGVNPRTPSQTAQRLKLAGVANSWRGLTQVERNAWKDAARLSDRKVTNRLGEARQLTGSQYFTKVNLIALSAGADELLLPGKPKDYPTIIKGAFTVDTVTGLAASMATAGKVDMTDPDLRFIVKMDIPVPPGQTPRRNRVIVALAPGDTGLTTTASSVEVEVPATTLEEVFGVLSEGYFTNVSIVPVYASDPWNNLDTTLPTGSKAVTNTP